jgi:uncharacterized repeat protein (TIGR01451 family)
MLFLLVSIYSFASAWLTKIIVWNAQYQNNGVVNYMVEYTNTWNSSLSIRFNDVLPVSLVSLFSATATCSGTPIGSLFSVAYPTAQQIQTNFCMLNPGQTATMTYSALILDQSFTTITNIANVDLYSWSNFLNSETSSASFSSYPVLSLTQIFFWLYPQKRDDLITLKFVLTNSGSAIANNVVLTNLLPNGFEYVSSTLPGTPSIDLVTNTITWIIPSISANSSLEYTVSAKLATSIPWAGLSVWSMVTNTATIATGSTTTPSYLTFASGGISSIANFRIAGIPFVHLTKTLTSPLSGAIMWFSWASVSYTITLTNTGTETAIGSITDMLPSEFINYSANIAPSFTNGNTRTWTDVSLAPWASTTIVINALLGSSYASNRIFTNTATFTYASNTFTGGLLNDWVVTGLIQWLPNLVLQKTLVKSASAGQSGDTVVYALMVTNSSTTSYTGSRCLIDTFPSQITLTSSSVVQSNCGNATAWQISFSGTTLPITIILTGILNTTLSSGSIIINSGVVSLQTGLELLSTDNISSAAFTVGWSDLVLNKTVWTTTYTGTPGTSVTYTLQYVNNGSLPISGVVLIDTLPTNLVYSSSSIAWAMLSWSTVSRNLGTLSAGQSGSITLIALISGYVEWGTVTNTATLTSPYSETNIQNNTSSASFTVTPALSDVKVVKSIASQGTYLSGTYYTFRFDVANAWGSTATGIKINDVLPSIFSYVSGSTNLIASSGVLIWWNNISNTLTSDTFSLSAGQSWYILLTAMLNNNVLATINYINTGTIWSVTSDASLSNNVSSVNGMITAPVISCSGLNYAVTAVSSLTNPIGFTTLSGLSVAYAYTLTNNLALPIESLTIGTTWPSQVSTPSGLVGGAVASVSNIPVWSGVSYTFAGTTTADGIVTITTPAIFTVKVAGGQPFTCTASSVISVSQTCGNNVINTNLGEQCENYNGNVIVAPWVSFNATTQWCDATCKIKTTKITNCAYMDVSGVIKNACIDTTNPLESPVLTIKKYVNNQDAQDNSAAVSTSQGSTVNYRVVITNTSAFTAYNVRFSDIVPNGVTYVSNSVSPTSLSYDVFTKILAWNLGNLAAWASITVIFNATIDNSTNGYINNIAKVNYADSLWKAKPELSDPAVIVLWLSNNTCNNGIKDPGEQCDLGNLPRTIGNYLDTTSNFLSYSDKNKVCTASCQIVDPIASRCGDGFVGKLEQCDMGNNSNIYERTIIWSYLDAIWQSLPSGVYAGKYCDRFCQIDSPDAPVAPACRYTDTVISVMKDEIFPFSRDVEIGKGRVIANEGQCNISTAWAIIEDSLRCTFDIYNKNEEWTNSLSKRIIDGVWCKIDQRADYKLFKPLYGTENSLFAEKPRGTYKVTLDNSIIGNSYGEYKLSLERVDYNYCDTNGKVVQWNPYARVCQVNFAVTDHYLMQKGSVSSKTNSNLSNYYTLDGKNIYSATDLNKVDKISSLDYTNLSSSMSTLTNNLIAKYEKIAVTSSLSDNEVKKVPGKSIYIMQWWKTFRWIDLTTPTTIIVKGDVNIEWNVSKNILLIATGKIKFTIPTPDKWIESCTTQVINGIIVAQWWFGATPNNGYKNTNLNNPRCRKGNLQVYGVLVGNNLDDLVKSRRSQLEHWFTFKKNGSYINVDDVDVKAERRDEIYKGASVYIEQNPSLWRDMPPAADDFLKKFQITRS